VKVLQYTVLQTDDYSRAVRNDLDSKIYSTTLTMFSFLTPNNYPEPNCVLSVIFASSKRLRQLVTDMENGLK